MKSFNKNPVRSKMKERHFFSAEEKQKYIWDVFDYKLIDIDIAISFIVSPIVEDDEELMEGAERNILRTHKYYERNPTIIEKAKKMARRENRLFCEVCSFNFARVYPELGEGFIECHHKQPISVGGMRVTRIKDLAIVCANCHRMLHRKYQGEYLTVEKLKTIFFT